MAHLFRDKTPQRTYTGHYSDYHKYKPMLAKDFNHHCGYTHCSDAWFGGPRTFQIDHFKPQKKFPELATAYSNLVYCCSYVNRLKSDKVDQRFLDPCNVDYNIHFERDKNGYIVGKTVQGKFMVQELSLNLSRYAYIWNLERLHLRIERLQALTDISPEEEKSLNELYKLYHDYTQSLMADQ